MKCPDCDGAGRFGDEACEVCRGEGEVSVERAVEMLFKAKDALWQQHNAVVRSLERLERWMQNVRR